MAKLGFTADVILSPMTGKEQWIITAKVKSTKVSTLMVTVDKEQDAAQIVGRWMVARMIEQLERQHSIHWADEEHPFQEELPF